MISSVGRENLFKYLNIENNYANGIFNKNTNTFSGKGSWYFGDTDIELKSDEIYTLSVNSFETNGGNGNEIKVMVYDPLIKKGIFQPFNLTQDRKKIHIKIDKEKALENDRYAILIYVSDSKITEYCINGLKLELGSNNTSHSISSKDIPYDTKTPTLYKTKILLSEPLRSVGDVKDRIYSDGLWKIERNVEVLSEDGAKTVEQSFSKKRVPTTEVLSQDLQTKLNNIASFKGGNYVYTVLDKSDILAPELHATFKSKAWYNNFNALQNIQSVSASLEIEAERITQTIVKVDGNRSSINQVESTANSNKATITNQAGELTQIKQDLTSITSTVANKADQSALTQLANSIDLRVQKTEADIQSESGRLTVEANKITGLLTRVNGAETSINSIKSTADSNKLTITNHTDKISAIEQNINGIQITVKGKADQSTVTQLENAIKLKVSSTDVSNIIKSDLSIRDTRNSNYMPNYYFYNYRQQEVKEFKVSAFIGLPSSESGSIYGLLVTYVHYADPTGGKVKQTFYSDSKTFQRFGTGVEPTSTINGGTWSTWIEIADKPYVESQIAVVNNAINLKVSKGDVSSQINIEAGRTLISTGKLILDANTYIMGTTFANDIKAKSLEAVNANIGDLRTKILTADVVTADSLVVNGATINKLMVGNLLVKGLIAQTLMTDTMKAKSLEAITANITSIRSQILVSNVVEATHLKADTAMINKLFATTALIDTLTTKLAFINSVKAIDIAADRITTGTLNAANVNLINVNASNIVTGTLRGANMDLNLLTGRQTFTDPLTGNTLILHQGAIQFQRGNFNRYIEYQSEGITIYPAYTNTGTTLNTSIHLNGGVDYIQANDRMGTVNYGRLQWTSDSALLQIPNGAEFRLIDMDNKQAGMVVNYVRTLHSTGDTIEFKGNSIKTPRSGNRNIWLAPNGTGSVVAGEDGGSRYNVVASDFVKQSTRDSKTNILPFQSKGLDVINRLRPVSYNKIDKLSLGIREIELGFIAEDNLEVATPDGKGIYDSHITAYLVKGMQELSSIYTNQDSNIAKVTKLATDNELEIQKLKERIEKLEESVA